MRECPSKETSTPNIFTNLVHIYQALFLKRWFWNMIYKNHIGFMFKMCVPGPQLKTPESVSSRTVPINLHLISPLDNFFQTKAWDALSHTRGIKQKDRIQGSMKLWMGVKLYPFYTLTKINITFNYKCI